MDLIQNVKEGNFKIRIRDGILYLKKRKVFFKIKERYFSPYSVDLLILFFLERYHFDEVAEHLCELLGDVDLTNSIKMIDSTLDCFFPVLEPFCGPALAFPEESFDIILEMIQVEMTLRQENRGRLLRDIEWIVHGDCDFRCAYCFRDNSVYSSERESVAFVEGLILEMRFLRVQNVSFSGGEPLNWELLKYAVRLLGENGISFTVVTKSLRNRSLLVDLLQNSYCAGILMSVDSFDKATLGVLVGDESYADTAFSFLLSLPQELRKKITISTVLTKYNIDEYFFLVENFLSIGVSQFIVCVVQPPVVRAERIDQLMPSNDDVARFLFQYKHHSLRDNILLFSIGDPLVVADLVLRFDSLRDVLGGYRNPECHNGATTMLIDQNYSVVKCDRLLGDARFIVGSLFDDSLLDAWYSAKMCSLVRPAISQFSGSACHSCAALVDCNNIGRCPYNSLLLKNSVCGIDRPCSVLVAENK